MKRIDFSRIMGAFLENCFKPDHKKSEDRKPTAEELRIEQEEIRLEQQKAEEIRVAAAEAERKALAEELGFEVIEPEASTGVNYTNALVSLKSAHALGSLESLEEIA